jgi:hypothetical protein
VRRRDDPRFKAETPLSGAPHAECGPGASRAGLIVLFFITTFSAGCYTYAETSLSALSPGIQARVRLTEDGFGRVVNQAAVSGVPVDMLDMGARGVVGRVRTLGPSSLTVELRGAGGSVFSADVQTQAVEQVAVRKFSRGRTIGAVAIGAALFAGIYIGTVGGTTSPTSPEEPELSVVPASSFFTRILSTQPATFIVGFSARLGSGR